jgi:hypothetical protein
MKAWFTSLNVAITLSVVALLTILARITFLDALFVSEFRKGFSEDQPWPIALSMLGYMAFVGGWIWALLAAKRGSRGGMIVALVFSLLVALGGGLLTLLVFCPTPCPTISPLSDIVIWAQLIVGLAASAALGLQLRQTRGR